MVAWGATMPDTPGHPMLGAEVRIREYLAAYAEDCEVAELIASATGDDGFIAVLRVNDLRRLLAEYERLRRELCKALAIPPDTPWDEVIADAHSAGVVRDAEYRALDRSRAEVNRLRAQRQAVLDVVTADVSQVDASALAHMVRLALGVTE